MTDDKVKQYNSDRVFAGHRELEPDAAARHTERLKKALKKGEKK